VTSLVAGLVVVWYILVQVLKRTPRVKVVPEIIELLDILLGGFVVAESRYGLFVGETSFGGEDGTPELEEVALLCLLLAGWFDIRVLVNRVILATLDGVEEDLGSLLNALKEGVVLVAARCSLLVRMMAKNLLPVSTLDLLLTGLVTVFREA
jgi:hypothetical protein